VKSYDRGRGAYYAKYVLRPDSRKAFLRGWWNVTMRRQGIYGIAILARELSSGYLYLRYRRANIFIVAAAPIAAVFYIWVIGFVSFGTAQRRLRRLARKILA
jgi:hypothetical protein